MGKDGQVRSCCVTIFMKVSRVAVISFAILFLLLGIAFVTTSRAGYETAAYKVEKKEGSFEVRKYESHRVATTPGGSRNGGFGTLFRYISGENEDRQKIAMTTPVFMPASGEGKQQEMQFVLPADVAESGAPAPTSSDVKIKTMPGGRYAVLRFSGQLNAKLQKKKLDQLRAKLREKGLKPTGSPIFAGYDPPWTPGPLRRNEVLFRLAK